MSRQVILINAPLKAAPQGSKTLGRWGGLREASKRVKPYRDALKVYAMEAMRGKKPLTGPVLVEMTFGFVQAVSNRDIYPTGRNIGDIDKLCRATLDALSGIVYLDDSQVSVLTANKYYLPKEEVEIQVWKLSVTGYAMNENEKCLKCGSDLSKTEARKRDGAWNTHLYCQPCDQMYFVCDTNFRGLGYCGNRKHYTGEITSRDEF